jgi:hypothetical protein
MTGGQLRTGVLENVGWRYWVDEGAFLCGLFSGSARATGQRKEMSSLDSMRQPDKPRKAKGAGRVRWWIVWTLFFSTVTNYISRQTFSVLAPLITTQYHLSHVELAKILGAFQVSYALT